MSLRAVRTYCDVRPYADPSRPPLHSFETTDVEPWHGVLRVRRVLTLRCVHCGVTVEIESAKPLVN